MQNVLRGSNLPEALFHVGSNINTQSMVYTVSIEKNRFKHTA